MVQSNFSHPSTFRWSQGMICGTKAQASAICTQNCRTTSVCLKTVLCKMMMCGEERNGVSDMRCPGHAGYNGRHIGYNGGLR